MSCITGLASKGRELFECSRNIISQIILDENSFIGSVVRKTATIGKNIFSEVIPHLLPLAPMYLSKQINFKIFTVMGCVEAGVKVLRSIDKTWISIAKAGILAAVNGLAAADVYGLIPPRIDHYIALESLFILTAAIGSSSSVYEGIKRMFSIFRRENNKEVNKKISDFISGAIITAIGVRTLSVCLDKTVDGITGLSKFYKLDPQQQGHVLKQRSIHFLGKEKSCKAVAFDGLSSSTQTGDFTAQPLIQKMYENCETKVYSVNSVSEFCESLADAQRSFGSTIDVVALVGHGDSDFEILGDDYKFRARMQEVRCMAAHLSRKAQIFLAACNTATSHLKHDLTQRLSDRLERIL